MASYDRPYSKGRSTNTQQKPQEPQECRNGCGIDIVFDYNDFRSFGKWRPIEYETGIPHDCPNSEYNRKKAGQTTIQSKAQAQTQAQSQPRQAPRVTDTTQTAIADSHRQQEQSSLDSIFEFVSDTNKRVTAMETGQLSLENDISSLRSEILHTLDDIATRLISIGALKKDEEAKPQSELTAKTDIKTHSETVADDMDGVIDEQRGTQ